MRRRAGGGTGGRPVGAPAADWWGCRISFIFMFFKNVRRVSLSPTANSLSSARELAHGKEALCRPLVAVSILPCVTHGKVFAVSEPAFAVCLWHTANALRPVVLPDLKEEEMVGRGRNPEKEKQKRSNKSIEEVTKSNHQL